MSLPAGANVTRLEALLERVPGLMEECAQMVVNAIAVEKLATECVDRFPLLPSNVQVTDPSLREHLLHLSDDCAQQWGIAMPRCKEIQGLVEEFPSEAISKSFRLRLESIAKRCGQHQQISVPPPTTKRARPHAQSKKKRR